MTSEKRGPLVIYHGFCADGFGAAWVVRRWFQKNSDDTPEFYPGVYQSEPPDVADRDVIMVDFSYKRDVIAQMMEVCSSMLIVDHHASAIEDLSHLVSCPVQSYGVWLTSAELRDGVFTVFDRERSGAGLAWDFFFPTRERPALIDRIEDRDLWRFQYPDTRAVQAALFSYPYDFEIWDRLMSDPSMLSGLTRDGEAIERKHFKDIAELLRVVARPMQIAGYVVPAANLPYTMTSDAGDFLAHYAPFGVCYWHTPDGVVFSLRSRDGNVDVSKVAQEYGGGGHPPASGFRVPRDRLDEFCVVADEVGYMREFWGRVDRDTRV